MHRVELDERNSRDNQEESRIAKNRKKDSDIRNIQNPVAQRNGENIKTDKKINKLGKTNQELHNYHKDDGKTKNLGLVKKLYSFLRLFRRKKLHSSDHSSQKPTFAKSKINSFEDVKRKSF